MGIKKIIDIHCHVLPGQDDGIETLKDSVEACRIAISDGIGGLVATPHMKEGFYEVSPEATRKSVSILQKALKEEGVDIEIYPGAEIHITDHLAEKVQKGSLLTINETGKYLLLELSYQQYPIEFDQVLFSLKLSGITPILAHPERVKYFQDDRKRIARAVHLGAFTQVTSSSILGYFGEEVKRFCLELASHGLMHIIGSDSHDIRERPPVLMKACKEIAKIVGEEEALAMIKDHPSSIIYGEALEVSDHERREKDEEKPGPLSFLKHLYKRDQE